MAEGKQQWYKRRDDLQIGPRRESFDTSGSWHSRGYLPHFEGASESQLVTFHLADSLPKDVLLRMDEQLTALPVAKRGVETRRRIDAWIDAGHGSCVLREPEIAAMVQESFLAFDAQRYLLLAWVVMPNHVHVLFQPIGNWTVAKIVGSWKKFTARRICAYWRGIGSESGGPVWHAEYWDRYIRDPRHYARAMQYIHLNPVKAGLIAKAEDWRWSSAHFLGTPIS
jgi:REP element-mobilizing transposase RayT